MNDDYNFNVPFTLEQHLNSFHDRDRNAERFIDSFHIIRDNMIKHLRAVVMIFPHYSDHSHEHSENIISAVERLLGKKRIEQLSPSDTWMLLVCAYMHDLGMLVQGKELQENWQTEEFQDYIQNCRSSFDEALRNAAERVSSADWVNSAEKNWSVSVYRDVILLVSEFYRRKHTLRAKEIPYDKDFGKYFNVAISGDGRIPPRIQEVIGKICFSHGISFEELLNLLEPADSLFGYEFHPRFIATMLCLGDLCDLDNGRFNKMSLEVFGEPTKINYVHYYKHESVNSFVLKKDLIAVNYNIQNTRIKAELRQTSLFAEIKNKDKELQDVCDLILLETQNWLGWIEDLLRNIKLYWEKLDMKHIEVFSPSLKYKVLVDGTETVSSRKNMRFSFSNEKAYELIESYSLYNNRFVFIRELLQNSVDALKRKFWKDIQSGRWDHLLKDVEKDENGNIRYKAIQPFDFSDPEVFSCYKVKMSVDHKPEQKYADFVIEDNGTGISKEDLQDRILRTGMRGKDKSVEEMPEWLKPTSAFGIGLHSVFGVSDSIFVKTRTDTDQPVYNINMHSGKNDGYVFMSLADNQNIRFCNSATGTRMEISIYVSKFIDDKDNSETDPVKDFITISNITGERPESDFCNKVQQELTDCLGLSLFDISYQFNKENTIHTKKLEDDDRIKLLFDSEKRNHIFYPDKPFVVDAYDFALSQNGKYCVLWNRKKSILFIYSINNIIYTTTIPYLRIKIHCKGFKVSKCRLPDNVILPAYIDYLGGNTQEIIDISRNNLSQKQRIQNEMLFSETTLCRAKIYNQVLKELLISDDIKEWHKNVDEFVEPWLKPKTDNTTIPDIANRLSEYTEKYINSGFDADYIKRLLLTYAFFKLVKKYKTFIESTGYYEDRSFNVIENFIHGSTEHHKILRNKTYLFDYIENSLNNNDAITFTLNIFNEAISQEIDKKHSFENWNIEADCTFNETNLLGVYFSVSLFNIIHLLLCSGIDISSSSEDIKRELSYFPGYNGSYGFDNKHNIGEILFSPILEISFKNGKYFNNSMILKNRKIEKITTNSDEKITIVFGNKYNERGTVIYDGNSFAVFLDDRTLPLIPVPSRLEDISITRKYKDNYSYNYELVFHYSGTYMTYLWDNFRNIKKAYTERIRSGESIKTLADEIMPASRTDKKPVLYVLRNICYDRAFNQDLPYDKAWNKIYDTYKKFVIKVLEAVKWLSEHEDELKSSKTTETDDDTEET